MAVAKLSQQDRIRATVSVTRNLGNYESLRVEATWESDLTNNENVDEAFDRVWAKVEAEVTEKVQEAIGE